MFKVLKKIHYFPNTIDYSLNSEQVFTFSEYELFKQLKSFIKSEQNKYKVFGIIANKYFTLNPNK